MNTPPIYLDYNATTPILPEVVDAMLPFLREQFGNPSSTHSYGARARSAVETARNQVAELLGCDADEVVFTSGGTEANNLAIRGVLEDSEPGASIVTSTIEHPAVARPCAWLERHDHPVRRVGVDESGRLDLAAAIRAIDEATVLVTVMHSNNETGVLQPIRELSEYARRRGTLLHTDAAQSVGKVPVRVSELGVDLLSVAGHKLYAPKGVGALYVRGGIRLSPFMLGAGHERGLRPGTENVASLVGLGEACARAHQDLESIADRTMRLRDLLWERLVAGVPGLQLNGHARLRLPNTLNVRFPHASGNAVLRGAPEVMASTGSACHGTHEQPSDVVLAMGVAPDAAMGSVRLTLGRQTTENEIERAASALIRSWQELQGA
ncbi:MAG: cysteine desulfurase family protein [Myxococcota bacterium]